MTPLRLTTRAPRPAGFTLIELLVVIGIIALLIGISIPVAFSMLGGAEVTRTRSALQAMSAALDEYKLQAGAAPNHKDETIDDLVVSDEDEGNDKDTTIGFFLSRVMQAGGTPEKMIRSGAKDLLSVEPTDGGGNVIPDFASASTDGAKLRAFLNPENWVMVDAWDTPLRYAASVSHDDAFEDDDYLPNWPNPFFASAGPDGEWGDAREWQRIVDEDTAGMSDDDIEAAKFAQDNVYSFDLE